MLQIKVQAARAIQQQRWQTIRLNKQDKSNQLLNAHYNNPFDLAPLKLTRKALSELKDLTARISSNSTATSDTTHSISHRTRFKIIKIARTIADLDTSDSVTETHLAEATAYNA
jgi:predicted ATPase with chaperone activity